MGPDDGANLPVEVRGVIVREQRGAAEKPAQQPSEGLEDV